jgi:hypothetical protein
MNLNLDLTNWNRCCANLLPEIMIIRLTALLLSTLLLPGISIAQSSDDAELRFYDVEVIIFKNVRVPKGKELILPVSSPRIDAQIMDLSSPASIKRANKKAYKLLSSKQLRLRDKVARIVKSPYYDLLLHVGWRQPGLEKEKSLPIWIRGGRIFDEEFVSIDSQLTALTPASENQAAETISATRGNVQKIYELEGKITVALSRYLHTYTDLVLRRPRLSLGETVENPESAASLQNASADSYILNNHSLKEHRRMRSKTLHYLDSPEFALLILITPYESSDVNTAAVQ